MRNTAVLNAPALIVGAGPAGLTLTIDLGRRDIACILIEQKSDAISTEYGATR